MHGVPVKQRKCSKVNRLVAAGTVAEAAATALDNGVLGDGDDVDGDRVELREQTG
jgi:hypothetical protein